MIGIYRFVRLTLIYNLIFATIFCLLFQILGHGTSHQRKMFKKIYCSIWIFCVKIHSVDKHKEDKAHKSLSRHMIVYRIKKRRNK